MCNLPIPDGGEPGYGPFMHSALCAPPIELGHVKTCSNEFRYCSIVSCPPKTCCTGLNNTASSVFSEVDFVDICQLCQVLSCNQSLLLLLH